MALGQLALTASGSRSIASADGWVEVSTFAGLTTALDVSSGVTQPAHGRITYGDGPGYIELGAQARIESDGLTRIGATLAKNGTPFGLEWHGDVSPGIGPIAVPRLEWVIDAQAGDVFSVLVASGSLTTFTLTIHDLGLDLTQPQQSLALAGGARVTESEVRRILRVVPGSYAVDLEIQAAHDMVERLVTPEGALAESDLRWIELYLAAHLVALGVPGTRMTSLATDGASQRFQAGKQGSGLHSTDWGKQALVWDTTGKLAEGATVRDRVGVWVMA